MMQCELCHRTIKHLTRHHLIPKKRHRNRQVRKKTTREERQAVALLCRPCHSKVHQVFSEKELAESYNTIGAIADNAEIQTFVDFIQKQPDGFKPKSSGRRFFKTRKARAKERKQRQDPAF